MNYWSDSNYNYDDTFCEFIEKNINLIDNNEWEDFILKVERKLSSCNAATLYQMLESADINILNYLHYIPHSFYYGRQNLQEYYVPKHILHIDNSAFDSCTELKSIHLPRSVASIGLNAFHHCDKLCDVYYDGTYDEYFNIEFRGFHANPIQSEKQFVRLHCSDRTLTYPPISNSEDDFDLPF